MGTFANTLLLSNAAVSLGGAFVSLEISLQFLIFFSLFSFILAWTFVSLQIKEFRVMGLSINDSVSSCLFFFLTGLHFFHLLLGLLLLSLFFWSCSFPSKRISCVITLRVLEVHLFYNCLLFYWHFLEILWLYIFLFFRICRREERYKAIRFQENANRKASNYKINELPKLLKLLHKRSFWKENYNSKKKDLEEEDQGEDERNVIL